MKRHGLCRVVEPAVVLHIDVAGLALTVGTGHQIAGGHVPHTGRVDDLSVHPAGLHNALKERAVHRALEGHHQHLRVFPLHMDRGAVGFDTNIQNRRPLHNVLLLKFFY